MTDQNLVDRANEIIESAQLLDDAIVNAHAFRMLLGNLVGRPLTAGDEPHAKALGMVRAAILRAEISVLMAILDPADRRGNRASIGHIVKELRDVRLWTLLVSHREGQMATPNAAKLAELQKGYKTICENELLQRVKRLRNDSIAHLLRPDTPTPSVELADVFSLQNEAERLVITLFEGLGGGEPELIAARGSILERAELFWDTYFTGMRRST